MRYATFGEALRDQARGRGEDDREIRHHRVAVDVENEVQRHSVQLLENQSGCHVAVADEQVTGSQRAAAGKAALEVCDRGGLADSTGAVEVTNQPVRSDAMRRSPDRPGSARSARAALG